jgi:hypothetical protein
MCKNKTKTIVESYCSQVNKFTIREYYISIISITLVCYGDALMVPEVSKLLVTFWGLLLVVGSVVAGGVGVHH